MPRNGVRLGTLRNRQASPPAGGIDLVGSSGMLAGIISGLLPVNRGSGSDELGGGNGGAGEQAGRSYGNEPRGSLGKHEKDTRRRGRSVLSLASLTRCAVGDALNAPEGFCDRNSRVLLLIKDELDTPVAL